MAIQNRTKFLVTFGVAAVVAASVALWTPRFRSEEASGAIGAVQKHHAPQITQKDVILGDEKTRTQQSVLYGDFFDNAQKLQAVSASLASKGESANISRDIEQLAQQMNARYAKVMNQELMAVEMSSKNAGNFELAQSAGKLQAELANGELSSAKMHELNAEFADIAEAAAKYAAKHNLQQSDELAQIFASRGGELKNADLASVEFSNVDMANAAEYFSQIEAASKAISQSKNAGAMDLAAKFANMANEMQAAAIRNVEEQNAKIVANAAAIKELQGKLASQEAANKAANSEMANLAHQVDLCAKNFNAYAASSLQSEVAAMGALAESRVAYSKLADARTVQASALASNDLAAKAVFGRLADTTELAHALANTSHALANEQLASILSNEDALAANVAKLSNELSSKQSQ